jgi:hypothetical protein
MIGGEASYSNGLKRYTTNTGGIDTSNVAPSDSSGLFSMLANRIASRRPRAAGSDPYEDQQKRESLKRSKLENEMLSLQARGARVAGKKDYMPYWSKQQEDEPDRLARYIDVTRMRQRLNPMVWSGENPTKTPFGTM